MTVVADVGVIGGSGLYSLLEGATEHTVRTPYGEPSDPITVADVGGRRVAFLPRHGRDHRFPPHRIPYRANLWALREIGVRQILAPCAVGGLLPALGPGTFVLPDQLVDRTSGRAQTFYDDGAVHVSFADPYCPTGRTTVKAVAVRTGFDLVDGGIKGNLGTDSLKQCLVQVFLNDVGGLGVVHELRAQHKVLVLFAID